MNARGDSVIVRSTDPIRDLTKITRSPLASPHAGHPDSSSRCRHRIRIDLAATSQRSAPLESLRSKVFRKPDCDGRWQVLGFGTRLGILIEEAVGPSDLDAKNGTVGQAVASRLQGQ
jgi:hypothetical protein